MRWPLRLLLALNAFDAGTTVIVVTAGISKELNPVMAALLTFSPFAFVGMKLVLGDVLISRLVLHWKSKSIRLIMYAIIAIYGIEVLLQVLGASVLQRG